MADEITVSAWLSLTNGELKFQSDTTSQSIDQAAAGMMGNVQTVGTSAEVLLLGDISTPGVILVKNLDATNYVEIGAGTGGSWAAHVKVKPGETWIYRLSVAAPSAQANTAPVKLYYALLET